MPGTHNMSDRDYEQEHRRNNRNGATNARISGFADSDDADYENADYASRYGPGHNGFRRGAVDFGHDQRGVGHRRGAEGFDRDCHDDLSTSENGDDKQSEGLRRVRRGSAADQDEFRGFLRAREFELRPVNSRYEEDLEFGHPGRGEENRSASEEDHRRWQQLRSSAQRPRHLEPISHDARAGDRNDFESRELRRAAPLTRHGMEERARYFYYEPHGPRREAELGSSRR